MEGMLRDMEAVLLRVCRRLESQEAQVNALPQKVTRSIDMDKLIHGIESLNLAPPPSSSTTAPPPPSRHPRRETTLESHAKATGGSLSRRAMWCMWFHGDSAAPATGPLLLLSRATLTAKCQSRWCAAAMQWFTASSSRRRGGSLNRHAGRHDGGNVGGNLWLTRGAMHGTTPSRAAGRPPSVSSHWHVRPS
ncbi:Aste57867_12146 [Aphanomyces stellatus]|uniref:Aste57867_12146 protein n=1 Tax=Aphanomyces stellatus TaxID=120398 RepID=A0A485KVE2_9STRA|nr:hypothetical protein As57867_012101 [Aphanomyces stellatus]VFT89000.1 Aste57867_12146 [Aphanomyces stellatus]